MKACVQYLDMQTLPPRKSDLVLLLGAQCLITDGSVEAVLSVNIE